MTTAAATADLRMSLLMLASQVLEVRHGAVVGIAELLPALHAAGVEVSAERVEKVAGEA